MDSRPPRCTGQMTLGCKPSVREGPLTVRLERPAICRSPTLVVNDKRCAPPDTEHRPAIVGQTVVEVIYSATTMVRGIITVDPRGVYRVRTELWDNRDWESGGTPFWSQIHLGTFTDTLENARVLCRERMAETEAP